jgi:hypothetical protein
VPRFSAFNSTHFTSKPPYEEQIYREMIKSLGSGSNYSTDWDSLVSARLYANAMAFGRCKYAIERLGQQFRPTRALENLPLLEREYGVIPELGASIEQRRAEVVVAARIARGASRPNVEAVLTELFGADFISYVTVASADVVTSPANPLNSGVYVKPGSLRGAFEILAPVSRTAAPLTVPVRLLAGSASTLRAGARIVIDSGNYARQEAVTVDAVVPSGSYFNMTATFEKPHNLGTVLATGRHASQATSKRCNLFVLSDTAAADAKKRRRLHRAARRLLRGISTWSASDDSGPFTFGSSRFGITTWGATP